MAEIERIVRLFKQVFEGSPYYGPSTLTSLKDITAEMAVIKPAWSVHCIWELVNHITAELQFAFTVLEKTAGAWVEGQTTWPVQTESRTWPLLSYVTGYASAYHFPYWSNIATDRTV